MRRILLTLMLFGLPTSVAMAATGATTAAKVAPSAVAQQVERRVEQRAGQRIAAIAADLRCRVCGSQSLADSDSSLARALRREMRGLIKQGRSDAQIEAWLLAHEGDFVDRPSPSWAKDLCPLGLLLAACAAAAVLLIATLRRRGAE